MGHYQKFRRLFCNRQQLQVNNHFPAQIRLKEIEGRRDLNYTNRNCSTRKKIANQERNYLVVKVKKGKKQSPSKDCRAYVLRMREQVTTGDKHKLLCHIEAEDSRNLGRASVIMVFLR